MASTKKKVIVETTKKCAACDKEKKPTDFYQSPNNPLHKDQRTPYCKKCIESLSLDESGELNIDKFKNVLMQIDKPFLQEVLDSTIDECVKKGSVAYVGWYMKNLALNYKFLTWKDSDGKINADPNTAVDKDSKDVFTEQIAIYTDKDSKNKEDVLRMLGYDPFETEYEADKPYLYSRLIDYLDESTLEDSFKLPASIEIVKSFNQIDKINHALSLITRDIKSISNNVGGIKSLFDAKEKILKSVLALAKDNGISVNHNNNKSKGAGTLSGIIKKLQELDLDEARVNLFDIETAKGIRQVADISNESIIKQLNFDENDYTEMIRDQRIIIDELTVKCTALEEENRKLKLNNLDNADNLGVI